MISLVNSTSAMQTSTITEDAHPQENKEARPIRQIVFLIEEGIENQHLKRFTYLGYALTIILPIIDLLILVVNKVMEINFKATHLQSSSSNIEIETHKSTFPRKELTKMLNDLYPDLQRRADNNEFVCLRSTLLNPNQLDKSFWFYYDTVPRQEIAKYRDSKHISGFQDQRAGQNSDEWRSFRSTGGNGLKHKATLLIPPSDYSERNLSLYLIRYGKDGYDALVDAILNTIEDIKSHDDYSKGVYVSTQGLNVPYLHIRLEQTPAYFTAKEKVDSAT
ncbi:MAG: hypothetical protein S4CHLAM20_04850 [Chlamydiia bacterium]|nr:hypothetical protein [Chlamydiia bacterium]